MILIRIETDKGPVTALFTGTVREAEEEATRLCHGIERWGRARSFSLRGELPEGGGTRQARR